ncbi:MAG: ABC transporter substrate-binding protein [Gammaproteobacteria bacterium]|nr:ABC transporter substrate-binding protein [Gammaproteobacteria bacterium]
MRRAFPEGGRPALQRAARRVTASSLWLVLLAAPVANARDITIAFGAEPTQVDPTRSSAGVDLYYTDLFYEGLLTVDANLNRVNWLAESWRVVERDGLPLIEITLREGVRFHNGETLTAEDVAFSFKRLTDPESRTAGRLRYVERVDVLDERRLEMVLTGPDGSLEPLNLLLLAIPKRYFEEVGDAGVQAHPIGTGPWRFISRKPRDELVVERFEDYWNPAAAPSPDINRLTIKIIPEDTTRVAAFKTGAVDWIDAVPPAQLAEFKAMEGVRVASLPTPNNLFIGLNAIDPASPFRFEKVRRAAAHAVDFDAIVKYILYGQGIRTAQLAPGSLGYDETLRPWPYDPDRARQLLAEAGFPAGVSVNCYNLTTPREAYIKEMGETVFAYLTEAGIRCRVVQLEYGAWINLARRFARPEMDGVLNTMWGQGLPGDPTDAWAGHVHSAGDGWGNYSYHSDPELDALIEELRTTMAQGRRVELIRHIARLKHERVAGGLPSYRPMITLAWRDTLDFSPWPGAFWRSMRGMGRPGP